MNQLTARPRRDTQRIHRGATPPALQTHAGCSAYNAIVAEKAAKTRKARHIGLAIFLVAAFVAGALRNGPAGGFAMVALLIAMLINFSTFSAADYYSIPGAVDENGSHRCIHCGGRGIYRHGQYKSNRTYADCSRCRVNLWQE